MDNRSGLSAQALSEKTGKRFFRYSAVSFTYYVALAFQSYLMVYLKSLDYSASQIGVVAAVNSVIGIFAAPFWGMMSDKFRSLKKIFIFSLSIGVTLYMFIPLASTLYIGGFCVIFALVPVQSFFKDSASGLVDSWTLRNATAENLNFGAIRSMGAFSYAVMSLILGIVLPNIGTEIAFYSMIVFAIPTFIFMASTQGVEDAGTQSKKTTSFKEMQIGSLFKNYFFVTYIIFLLLRNISMMPSMNFLPFLLSSVGADPAQIGIVLCSMAMFQIPTMLLLKPLRNRIPLHYFIIAGTVLEICNAMFLSIAGSFVQIIFISAFHGLAGGVTLAAGASYVFSLAPEKLKATTQTLIVSVGSIAGIIGSSVGGALVDSVGIRTFYFVLGILISISLVFFTISFFFGDKVLKIKRNG